MVVGGLPTWDEGEQQDWGGLGGQRQDVQGASGRSCSGDRQEEIIRSRQE